MAKRKEWRREMEGSLSVLSTPSGMPGTSSGKGRSTMEALVSKSEWAMKGLLDGVVKTVTAARLRLRRKRARWRSGMVWPLAMNGNKTAWRDVVEWPRVELIFSSSSSQSKKPSEGIAGTMTSTNTTCMKEFKESKLHERVKKSLTTSTFFFMKTLTTTTCLFLTFDQKKEK